MPSSLWSSDDPNRQRLVRTDAEEVAFGSRNRVVSGHEPSMPPRKNQGEAVAEAEVGEHALRALDGIRVCDLGGQLAGAGATRYLAAFGAEVIRVEDPSTHGGWDIVRGAPPYVDDRRGIELGGGFNNHNVGKLGATINLRTEKGKALLRSLIAVSDVVTENFSAGVFARMGFSYAELCRLRPDVIYVSNCGFGATGPYSRYRTWGPIVQAVSGLTSTSALAGHEPAGWGYSYMDHMGANYMALAVLAAIVHRNRTGEGQWVDMSCSETAATLTGTDILDHDVNRRSRRLPDSVNSNRSEHPAMAPHGIYPSRGEDEWVAIACRNDSDWMALCRAARLRPEVRDGFATLDARLGGQDELDAAVSEWTVKEDRFAVARLLVDAGVPASVVARPEDRIDNDQVTADWGLWPTVDHPDMGTVRVDGLPVHLSRTDWTIERSAPRLGQHNDYVMGEVLGLSRSEIDGLVTEGVL
jgi:crotonobetainyl-CoA:carnitine CoA-transferase CaiB-like acyl-CoA transferase